MVEIKTGLPLVKIPRERTQSRVQSLSSTAFKQQIWIICGSKLVTACSQQLYNRIKKLILNKN
jgi:hypothetical protein